MGDPDYLDPQVPGNNPVAVDDLIVVNSAGSILIDAAANDLGPSTIFLFDADSTSTLGAPVTVETFSTPSPLDDAIRYSVPSNVGLGVDRFDYVIKDVHGRTAAGTVSVQILIDASIFVDGFEG